MPAAVPILVGGAVATGAAATIGTAIAGAAIGTAVATGIGAAVVGTGAALATGQKPSDALKTGVVSGLTAGVGSSVGSALAGGSAMADAAFVAADAAQLAAQGLSEAAIAQNIVATGVSSTTAATAASLAASGATESAIASSLGPGTLFTETPAPTPSFSEEINLVQDATFPQEGLQVPSIDSSQVALFPEGTVLPGEGLLSPTLPSVGAMGGGQGLSVPVSGGTVTEAGFTPIGATPVLGDPGSFINDPNVLGQPVIQDVPSSISITDALRGANLANQLMGGQQTATGFPQQQAPFQPTGVDYSGIYGLLGQRASVPGIQGLLGPAQLRYPSLLG
jgi:hypothetical protein